MNFFFAEHCTQHYHSTQYTLPIIHFKKSAQQHSGHKSKPQESSETANEMWLFQRQMKALTTSESQLPYTSF